MTNRRGFLSSLATATLAVAMDVLPRFGADDNPIRIDPWALPLQQALTEQDIVDWLTRIHEYEKGGLRGIVEDLPKGHYIAGKSRTTYPKVH